MTHEDFYVHPSPVATENFTWDICNVVKQKNPTKISFAQFAFEVQTFQLLQNFLAAKPMRLLSEVTWTFHNDKSIYEMAAPQLYQG